MSQNQTAVAEDSVPRFEWCSPDLRAAANCFLRSNLCAAIHGSNRRQCNNEPIKTTETIKMFYSGEQLARSDFTVYSEILDMSRNGGREFNMVGTTLNQLLKRLGKSAGGKDIKWIKGILDRLYNANLRIESKNGEQEYEGRLINDRGRSGDIYFIDINKRLGWLFAQGYCRLNAIHLTNLSDKPLAQWLYGFYASHKLNLDYLYNIESIHELSGSTNGNLAGFEQKLKDALNDLYNEAGWRSRIMNIKGKKDLLLVLKPEDSSVELQAQFADLWQEINSNSDTLKKFNKKNAILIATQVPTQVCKD